MADDDVVAVLVVPAENDPGGLLAPGQCGATPPRCRRLACRAGHTSWESGVCDHPKCRKAAGHLGLLYVLELDAALPLVWDGALVPEGWDRARRRYEPPDTWAEGRDPIADRAACDDDPGPQRVEALAAALVRHGVASRVVRLARVDGRLVEVPRG